MGNKIGKLIRELRNEKEMSADKLAELLGKEGKNRRQYIYNIERGNVRRVDPETINSMSIIFNVPVSKFLGIETEMVEKGPIRGNVNFRESNKESSVNWQQKYYEALDKICELQNMVIKLTKNR